MAGTFSHEVRIRVCLDCGNVRAVPIEGGDIECPRCGVVERIPPRPMAPLGQEGENLSETEHLGQLRAQDGKPAEAPAEILQLLEGNGIAPWKLDEAKQIWLKSARQVRDSGDAAAAERLFLLTLIMEPEEKLDVATRRAYLETALELLDLPRHRQVLRCTLASASVLRGDLESARSWLEGCDRRSPDLMADSARRLARALLATAEKDYVNVLDLLEPGGVPWPVHDSYDHLAVCLRANAHEKLGDEEMAGRIMWEYTEREGLGVLEVLRRDIEKCGALEPCSRSFGALERKVDSLVVRREVRGLLGNMSVPNIIGGILLVAGLGIDPSNPSNPGFLKPIFLCLAAILIVGGNAFFLLRYSRRKRRIMDLLNRGRRVRARITSADTTGWYQGTSGHKIPQYLLSVEIPLADGRTYRGQFRRFLEPHVGDRLSGTSVVVCVDPDEPENFVPLTM